MAIIIHELEHRYEDGSAGEKVALHDVNIKIEQGEMIGLIGHTAVSYTHLMRKRFRDIKYPVDSPATFL